MTNQEVIIKLKEIESVLQDHENSIKELKKVVEDIQKVVKELDKNVAVQIGERSHTAYMIERLQKEIDMLEAKGEKGNDRQRDLVEKTLMALIGGLIGYVFSLAKS